MAASTPRSARRDGTDHDRGDGTAGQAFGLSSYPFFVAIDGSGKVVARATGEITVDAFEALIDKARKGAAA